MMMQTAKVADSIGALLDDSSVRFLQISSGYYNAYFYQNADVKVGAIAEKAMSLGEFKELIHG